MHPHLNRKRQAERARTWEPVKDALGIAFLAFLGVISTIIIFAAF